jgi:hypothetical protein
LTSYWARSDLAAGQLADSGWIHGCRTRDFPPRVPRAAYAVPRRADPTRRGGVRRNPPDLEWGRSIAGLRDIAHTRDVATARWVAETLQYPDTNPQLSGPAWPWALALRPIVIAVVSAVAVALIITMARGWPSDGLVIGRRSRDG